jgi:prepilin peptidase CpaA
MEGDSTMLIPVLVVISITGVAAVTDARHFQIHNVLTIPFIVTGLAYHSFAPTGAGWSFGLLGALVGFALLLFGFLLGGFGAGDVKLLTGIGAWLGPLLVLVVFLASSLVGGLFAVVIIVRHGQVYSTFARLRVMGYQLLSITRFVAADADLETLTQPAAQSSGRVIPYGAVMFTALTLLVLAALVMTRWGG